MSRIWTHVSGDAHEFWPDAQHAGAFDAGQSALIITTEQGRVICLASGPDAALMRALEPGDLLSVSGMPRVGLDLDGRPVLVLCLVDWELVQGRAETAPIWRLRLALLVNAVCGWVERRLAAGGR